jgi:branched-subunit amino acid transport protein
MDASAEWWPWLKAALLPWGPWFVLFALWITLLLTTSSGALYLWRNRKLYLQDV